MQSTSAERQEIEPKVSQFPVNVVDAYEQYLRAKKDEVRAKKRKDALKIFLDKSIPYTEKDEEERPIGLVDGIIKVERSKRSTKWKEVFTQTKLEAVPPGKQHLVDQFVTIYTSVTTYPDFKREED